MLPLSIHRIRVHLILAIEWSNLANVKSSRAKLKDTDKRIPVKRENGTERKKIP